MSKDPVHSIAALVIPALRYVAYAGVIVCSVGLLLAIREFYPLWFHSIRTDGTLSGYQTISWQSGRSFGGASTSPASANLPVITFQSQTGERFTFVDKAGHDRLLKSGEAVAVIYEADNPSNAIADKGFANWMAIYIWLFGFTASALGAFRFQKLDERGGASTTDVH